LLCVDTSSRRQRAASTLGLCFGIAHGIASARRGKSSKDTEFKGFFSSILGISLAA
jgi:hypothetical protein